MLGMPSCCNSYGYGNYAQPGYGYPSPQMGGYPPAGYGMPMGDYGANPYPTTDPSSTYMYSMCMGVMQQLMGYIMSLISSGRGTGTVSGTQGSGNNGCSTGGTGSTGGTSKPTQNEPDSPDSNTEALELLEEYADKLPAGRNGRLDKEALEEFANGNSDAPSAVKDAARMISENEELYNLLCLQSGNEPDEGIDRELFEDGDWDDIDAELDELESFREGDKGDEDAMEVLQEHQEAIAKLSGNESDNDITVEDLQNIALGEAEFDDLDDDELAELQAAALRILSDEDLLEDLDEYDDGNTGTEPNNTKSDSFNKNAFQEWLTANA